MAILQQSPLREAHLALGARLVPFGGWEMPVQYVGIVQEHLAVRRAAGLFDISHMGEFFVSGSQALAFLNAVLTNDASRLAVGQGQYTLLCNEAGGVVDDLYLYRLGETRFCLVVNASRIAEDLAWLEDRLRAMPELDDVQLRDGSTETGAVAVQGPAVPAFIDLLVTGPAESGTPAERPSVLRKNETAQFRLEHDAIWLARTGYTGEDGFECFAPATRIGDVWSRLMELGEAHGLMACGLGARDTLRTEMGYPLYGHELTETITPLEAGLGTFVALEKGPFVGRAALVRQRDAGLSRKCAAFRMTAPSPPPRPDYALWSMGAGAHPVGRVASGTQSPSLGVGIGMGYVPVALARPGTPLDVEIRGRRYEAVVARRPLYRKPV